MLRSVAVAALALSLSSPALAEVLVEVSPHPLTEGAHVGKTAEISESAGTPAVRPKRNTPAQIWHIPRFRVDRTSPGDTTLLAIRTPPVFPRCHEVCSDNVTVTFYDVHHTRLHVKRLNITGHRVVTFNLRDVPDLAVDPDGFARGMITVGALAPVSVDYFQVDTSQNFATGGEAFSSHEFCESWAARFLSFGPGQTSVLSFFVREPKGASPTNPPTVRGEIYDEAGVFVNSFVIRTDEWSFDVEVEEIVLGGISFGTVELTIFDDYEVSTLSPGGMVTVTHSARDRFSIGMRAICTD